jgi:hypothetical protein
MKMLIYVLSLDLMYAFGSDSSDLVDVNMMQRRFTDNAKKIVMGL